MLAQVDSAVILGIDAFTVQVEVDCAPGMDKYFIVGLPDTAVREAQERVRVALRNSQFTFPNNSRLVVNLAPADIKKEGPGSTCRSRCWHRGPSTGWRAREDPLRESVKPLALQQGRSRCVVSGRAHAEELR